MGKVFNVTGACNPMKHYMVDITDRLAEIKVLVDQGAYFTMNRARQYGKTTTLAGLCKYLQDKYLVVYVDFQFLSQSSFENESSFINAFTTVLLRAIKNKNVSNEIVDKLGSLANGNNCNLATLFFVLSDWCAVSDKPVVLIIDEVDSATNNQVFLDFLAQMRGYYINRDEMPTFQSVILAGVHDVKNIKHKIRPDDERKLNSPWNIAAKFDINMSLDIKGIQGMLADYESEHHTNMDIVQMAQLIYEYTSGYPFLVSRICKIIDEELSCKWTKEGFLEAVNILLMEKNTLFESLMGKVIDYPELSQIIYTVLFAGEKIIYNPDNSAIDMAQMYGFVKNDNGGIAIANRIFEIRLYNYFLSTSEAQNTKIFKAASYDKNQYIKNGHLDMDTVMSKFVEHFDLIYGDNTEEFDEEEGRRRFLLYLRPIINGTGNYYIEARTRNARRMDIVIDYHGEQFIVELKIWRGNAYNERGEEQLCEYLDYFHVNKGYLLSYNFNKKKEIGVKEVRIGEKVVVEAVV
jgi:hypothetical protein